MSRTVIKAIFNLVLFPSLAILLLTGCGGSSYDSVKVLRLGILLPETGSFSSFSSSMFSAIRLAAFEINQAGTDLQLWERDSGTNPDVANNAIDDLLNVGVDAVVGAATSGVSLAILDKLSTAKVVHIAPSNSSPTFTTYADDNYYFRTLPSDALRIKFISNRLIEQGIGSAAIVFRNDDYGLQVSKEIKEDLEEKGVTVTDFIQYDPMAESFATVIQSVQAVDIRTDAYIISSFDELVPLLREMFAAGITPADKFFYLTVAASVDLGEQVNPDNPGIVAGIEGTEVSLHPQAENTFLSRLQEFSPNIGEVTYAAYAYDAVVILALASLEAESTDPEKFRTEINGITRDGTKCNHYVECARLIEDGTDIDYDGASGPLEFSAVGEPTVAGYQLFRYDFRGLRQFIPPVVVLSDNTGS